MSQFTLRLGQERVGKRYAAMSETADAEFESPRQLLKEERGYDIQQGIQRSAGWNASAPMRGRPCTAGINRYHREGRPWAVSNKTWVQLPKRAHRDSTLSAACQAKGSNRGES